MMQKSPFKFLDSYTKEDRDIFFGRDKEIEELYLRIFESKLLLIYGISGTGKSSLINCGLANKFNDTDWLPISVRRGNNINQSLFDGLYRNALTKTPFEKNGKDIKKRISLHKALQSVYLDHFKPIYLIFDQFEELFIFGNKEEKDEFIKSVKKVLDSDIQCRFIFSIREEYLAGITEFEKLIPTFFDNRVRIERMTRQNAIQAIEGPCKVSQIEVEPGFPEALLDKLNPNSPDVELTYLQVFLDKVHKLVEDKKLQIISQNLLPGLGEVKDLLGSFLEEQISQLSDPETALTLLKSFVSAKGTRHQVNEEEIIEYSRTLGKEIDHEALQSYLLKFISLRILRDKDENGKYELRHDSLALKIYEKITLVEKELLEIRYFLDNAFNNFEKRQVLLSLEDLKYIAPYEDKLFLNEKTLKFISQSKWAMQRAKRRRQNLLIAASVVLFSILSAFSIWAIRERGNAMKQKQIAVQQKNTAVKAMEEAENARKEAMDSKKQAEENERLAMLAKNQSEQAKKEALLSRETAMEQKHKAEDQSAIAKEQASIARNEKQLADQQKKIAETAEEKARRLGMLSTAQNLALKSALQDKDPQLMASFALLAFTFNKNNGGDPNDPVIYEALNKAYSVLDNNRHSIFTGSPNEIRALAETENGLISIDLDGQIRQWDYNGLDSYGGILSFPSLINFVFWNSNATEIVTGYDNTKTCLWERKNVTKNSPSLIELTGSKTAIRTASFTADQKFLATAGNDSMIYIWDLQEGAPKLIKALQNPAAIKAIVFCNEDSIITGLANKSFLLWDLHKTEPESLLPSNAPKYLPLCLAWNARQKVLLAGCSDGQILAFYMAKGSKMGPRKFALHSAGIDLLAFNHDYTLLASGCWDKTVNLYHFESFFMSADMSGKVFQRAIKLNTQGNRARSMIFTRDDKLAIGLSDKTIRIWECSSQKLADNLCSMIKWTMDKNLWNQFIGNDIPYEIPCSNSLNLK
jgi:WD40 repeat protein